jgi:hypothetical protein
LIDNFNINKSDGCEGTYSRRNFTENIIFLLKVGYKNSTTSLCSFLLLIAAYLAVFVDVAIDEEIL